MYNVGDKFIIEIGDVFESPVRTADGITLTRRLYQIKGFNSLVFDSNGLDRLEQCAEVEEVKCEEPQIVIGATVYHKDITMVNNIGVVLEIGEQLLTIMRVDRTIQYWNINDIRVEPNKDRWLSLDKLMSVEEQ